MKSNASQLLSILDQDPEMFFMIDLEWNNTHRFCTNSCDVTWNGNVYDSNSPLLKVDPAQYSTVIDREVFTLELDGLNPTIKNEIEVGVVYRPVSVRVGFNVNGVFQSGLDQTIHSYKGRVGNVSRRFDDGSVQFIIECTAPLADLDAASPVYTTPNAKQLYYPTDTCYDGLHIGASGVELEWGKK